MSSQALEGIEAYMVANADSIRAADNTPEAVAARFKFWGDLVHDAPLLLAVVRAAAEEQVQVQTYFKVLSELLDTPSGHKRARLKDLLGGANEDFGKAALSLQKALAALSASWSGSGAGKGQGDE